MNLENIVDKFVYENALKHGQAKTGSVLGAIIAAHPELKEQAKEIASQVSAKIDLVNKMGSEKIERWCRDNYPEFFEKEEKIKRKKTSLPPLEGGVDGEVCTRLPPEPSGYLHIGHGYAGFINYYYAKHYNGKLILRFEDTNPRKVELKYYEKIRDDFRYMGIYWDEEINESDRIPMYYDYAQQLIEEGNGYVCGCSVDIIRDYRHKGKECEHRNRSSNENLEYWEQMLEDSPEGKLSLRLKVDMSHTNAALRDPSIMRVIEASHCLQGDKYRVWPLYDFAVAIEDSVLGITHVLRSEEFVQKVPLQNHIRDILGLRSPRFVHFSRLRLSDVPVQKRLIRELIKKGIIDNWNDFRLSTISGMRSRGIVPETIKQIAFDMQLSTGQSELDLSILLAINRKIVDDIARRIFAVINPITLYVDNLPEDTIEVPYHPKKDLGHRKIPYTHVFYVNHRDLEILKPGETIRLKDLVNITITEIKLLNNNKIVVTSNFEDDPSLNFTKIQWVPKNYCLELMVNIPGPLYINGEINPSSLRIENGFIEKSVLELQKGDLIQLERIGFGKIVDLNQKRIELNLTESLQ
ncbi:MAG: glutamate--tRNA ligase [Candidatus Heimdallarchaeota archaeon]|nr:MAG: glutamate--tRNA ligase [Candidatus Heimdallarchaeota archaeon]